MAFDEAVASRVRDALERLELALVASLPAK